MTHNQAMSRGQGLGPRHPKGVPTPGQDPQLPAQTNDLTSASSPGTPLDNRPAQTDTPISSMVSSPSLFVESDSAAYVWKTQTAQVDIQPLDISDNHVKTERNDVQSWILESSSPDAVPEQREAKLGPTYKSRKEQLQSTILKPSKTIPNVGNIYEAWRRAVSPPDSNNAWSSPLPSTYLPGGRTPSKRVHESILEPVYIKKARSDRSVSDLGGTLGKQLLPLKLEARDGQSLTSLFASLPKFPLPPPMSPLRSTAKGL
jgi:hypothetical protein